MAVSQLPQAPYRQDRKLLPTPLIADVLFSEIRDCNRSEFPAYGTPHPNAAKWPKHKLVYIKPVDIERNEIFEFFYAADRADQDLYNWEYAKTEIRGVKYDSVVRTYLTLRDDFVQETPELDTIMPDVPTGVFTGTYTFFEKMQSRTGEKELDSIFVTEKHVYVDLSDVAISDLTTNDFGGILATKRDRIVEEGTQSETGFGIIESSTTSLGNGKSVQSVVRAPVDALGNPVYPVIEGSQIDSRYGVIFDYTRQIVEAGSVDGDITQNGAEFIAVEVEPKDQWRSFKTETRLASMPEDQVWYGLRRENLPEILAAIEIVGTERWVAIPTFKRVPDGPLKARFTRKFSFGTPADYDPTNARVPYATESYQYALEYEAVSLTISSSSGTSFSSSSSSGDNQSTNTSESNSEGNGTSKSTSDSINDGTSTTNSSSNSSGTSSGTSFSSYVGVQSGEQFSSSTNTGSSGSTNSSSGGSNSTNNGTSTTVSSSVGLSNDTTTTTDDGVPLASDPSVNRSSANDSSGTTEGRSTSTNSGTQSSNGTSLSSTSSISVSSGRSSGNNRSSGDTVNRGTSSSSGTSFQSGTSNSTNKSVSEGTQESTNYSKSLGTSGSISSGTNSSNTSSSSSSASTSRGKTIFSLSIPKCLHGALPIALPNGQSVTIPATVPPTLAQGWFEVSRQAEHWKYGIWVTEIIEVYIPAI